MIHAKQMILPLPRPQYVAVPEGFLTSLAWRAYSVELDTDPQGKKVGLRFRGLSDDKKRVVYRITEPAGEQLTSLGETAMQQGIMTLLDETQFAEATLNSILGIRSEKGKFQPASPLCPSFALLQNMSGIQGAENPPDLAEIIEAIFSLGETSVSNPTNKTESATSHWKSAMQTRLQVDPLLKALDAAFDSSVLEAPRQENVLPSTAKYSGWAGLFPKSPFVWFNKTWTLLTSDEWVHALPARVWVDWATTVLRQAFALSYLFEVSWYESLARSILSEKEAHWSDVTENMDDWFPWKSSTSGIEIRDVSSNLKWKCHRGVEIRSILQQWIDQNNQSDEEFSAVISKMSKDAELCRELMNSLGSRREQGKNLWEAVRYSLITREANGPHADHFGLLKARGTRFLVADPGTEWITVLASLSGAKPKSSMNLGEVSENLKILGSCPEPSDLISLLERAGLARGSADADQGVTVETAY